MSKKSDGFAVRKRDVEAVEWQTESVRGHRAAGIIGVESGCHAAAIADRTAIGGTTDTDFMCDGLGLSRINRAGSFKHT